MSETLANKTDTTQFINPRNHSGILKYFDAIKNFRGYIDLLDTGVDDRMNTATTVRSEQLYIAPKFSKEYIDPQTSVKDWSELFDLDYLLDNHPVAFLIGDPGTGKTTFVNRISTQLSQTNDNAFNKKYGFLIPFPFTLRDLTAKKIKDWNSLLKDFFSKEEFKKLDKDYNTWLTQAMETGQVIFLFDGLDEVNEETFRNKLSEIVLTQINKYPKCRWWFTTRPVGFNQKKFLINNISNANFEKKQTLKSMEKSFKEVDLGSYKGLKPFIDKIQTNVKISKRLDKIINPNNFDVKNAFIEFSYKFLTPNFPELYFAPFDNKQIYRFAHLWFELQEPRESIRRQQTDAFIRALEQQPSVQHLARIPILLTMTALFYRVRRYFPDGRITLYKSIAQAYLKDINVKRNISIDRQLSLQEQMKGMGRLALKLNIKSEVAQKDSHLAVSQVESEILFFEALKNNFDASKQVDLKSRISAFFSSLHNRSEILIPKTTNSFSFLHLSYQEYFASEALRDDYNSIMKFGKEKDKNQFWDKMRKYANNPIWHETLVLFFEGFKSDLDNLIDDCRFCFDNIFKETDQNIDYHSLLAVKLLTNNYIEENFENTFRNNFLNNCFIKVKVEESYKYYVQEELNSYLINWGSENNVYAKIEKLEDRKNLSNSLRWVEVLSLEDITFLKEFPQLIYIDCSNSQLKDLTPLQKLTYLRVLDLNKTQVRNIKPLEKLANLQWLSLHNTQVRNINPLEKLTNLQWLNLYNTKVRDIEALGNLSNLEWLNLHNTQVSNIKDLEKLTNLQWLNLYNTQVSDIKDLEKLIFYGLIYIFKGK